MAEHKHNENGNRNGPYTMTVGKEIWTYYQVYCTCGAYRKNDVTNREKKE